MMIKCRKLVFTACLLMCCAVSGFPLNAAENAPRFTVALRGRLLYVAKPGGTGDFAVLAGAEQNGVIACRKPGQTQMFSVRAADAKVLPFEEDVSALTATQYALYAYSHGRMNGWEVQLAQKINDTTGRTGMLAEYEIARNSFLKKIKAVPKPEEGKVEPEDYADAMSDVLLDSNPVNEVLRKALAGEDRILAIALLENYRLTLMKYQEFFTVTPELQETYKSEFDTLVKEFLENIVALKQRSNARQERFRRRFPRARGLWCEAPPTDYSKLFRMLERSLEAFARLDDLSSVTEPEEWGSALLDALLLTEGSMAGEELEAEFDGAMGELEKRMTNKEAVKP